MRLRSSHEALYDNPQMVKMLDSIYGAGTVGKGGFFSKKDLTKWASGFILIIVVLLFTGENPG